MLNKVVKSLILIFALLAICFFTYFYYIKPQREFIKANTQECIKQAMMKIDNEVNKSEYATHNSDEWFVAPLKNQQIELEKCTNNYNTIIFSSPEKKLLELNINSLINIQKSKIDSYKKVYSNIKKENAKQQAKIDKCNEIKKEYDAYIACQGNDIYSIGNCAYPRDAISNMASCLMLGIKF